MSIFAVNLRRLPPDTALAEVVNEHADAIERLSSMTGAGNLVVSQGPAGPVLSVEGLSAGITVEEVDGSPSYASVVTLRFDQADGFVVSQPAAGIARVDITEANGNFGIVGTSAVSWAGTKTFTSQTRFNANARLNKTLSDNYLYLDGEELTWIRQFYYTASTHMTIGIRAADDSGGTGKWCEVYVDPSTFDGFVLRSQSTTPSYWIERNDGAGATFYQGGTAITGGLTFKGGLYISGSASGLSDGNKGDITVSGSGSSWTINPATITGAKLTTDAAVWKDVFGD